MRANNGSRAKATGVKRQVNRKNLLDDYASLASKRGIAAEATAIRTQSAEFREIFAHSASNGTLNFQELKQRILKGWDLELNPLPLAQLARVSALQNFEDDDEAFALRAFSLTRIHLEGPKLKRFRKLEIELLITNGEDSKALELISQDEDIRKIHYNYLQAELMNPYRAGAQADRAKWIRALNAPLKAHKLSSIEINDHFETPFDGLFTSGNSRGSIRGPLISVIMTTFSPEKDALFASVNSILKQTWEDLELIIVDDASPPQYSGMFDSLKNLDSRIKIVKAESNGGTYLARNLGLEQATGQFVTGQDDDDWSHPNRLQTQVEFLLDDRHASGCRVYSIAATEDMSRVRPGYVPNAPNASSLMFRRDLIALLGGYLPARKAADTEFQKRLEIVSGRPVIDLKVPLTFVRIRPDSLSRSDFKSGWSHPSRREFRSSYSHWHTVSKVESLRVEPGTNYPVAIPERFAVMGQPARALQVVFAGDWRQYGGPQKSMLEEMRALVESGLSVGVMHLEAPRFMSSITKPLCSAVQELINQGYVRDVLYDEEAEVDLLIVRYPPIFQFPSKFRSRLKVQKLIILANQAPSERDGSDIRYVASDCSKHAEEMFGIRAIWVPQGPTVRGAVKPDILPTELAEFDMPGILSVREWATNRDHFRNTLPVAGRHSRDNTIKWPDNTTDIIAAYPIDGSVDVRIMGGALVPLEILGLVKEPNSWVVFETDEMSVRTFLSSLDFFVYFQHDQGYEAFGRAVLEAIATGCVVILPHHYEPVFGDAALYCTPSEVGALIAKYHSNPKMYSRQSNLAFDAASSRFSHQSFVDLVDQILDAEALDFRFLGMTTHASASSKSPKAGN